MTTTEFPIDLDTENEGLGTLFITDARALIRPAVPGQYPASVRHNSAHAYGILSLGNDMGAYTTHIFCQTDPQGAHKLLDRVFYAFTDACCLQLWCDARVYYIVDGDSVWFEEYGFEDGEYTMRFNVHCNVAEGEAEAFLATLTSQVDEDERFLVVRPDSSETGYSVRGYIVDQSSEDDYEEPYDEDDDICECGQPGFACVCAEMESYRRFQADPATAGSWWTP